MKKFRYRAIEVPCENAYGQEPLSIQVQRQVKYFSWSPFWFHDGYEILGFNSWDSAEAYAFARGNEEADRRKKLLNKNPRVGRWWP